MNEDFIVIATRWWESMGGAAAALTRITFIILGAWLLAAVLQRTVRTLRDGMNLVAKEFVAAQDPEDPGVLVLSRFAGAAEQLPEALLVNPYDTLRTAETIQRALQMPLDERQRRHQALLARIREHDVYWWRQQFLAALAAIPAP
jgi:trehalose 6-phosphate synthase